MVGCHNPKVPVITKKLVVHSPGTFGGAWLLSRKFPRFGILRYMIASMVAFTMLCVTWMNSTVKGPKVTRDLGRTSCSLTDPRKPCSSSFSSTKASVKGVL